MKRGRLTVADNIIVLASLTSLLVPFIGIWPNGTRLQEWLWSAESLGYVSEALTKFWWYYRSLAQFWLVLPLAALCSLLAVLNLFSATIRRVLHPVFWLLLGLVGLVDPIVNIVVWNAAHSEILPIQIWGVYAWLGCYVLINLAAANKLAARSSEVSSATELDVSLGG